MEKNDNIGKAIIITILVVAIVLIGYLCYRINNIKNEKTNLENTVKELQDKVNAITNVISNDTANISNNKSNTNTVDNSKGTKIQADGFSFVLPTSWTDSKYIMKKTTNNNVTYYGFYSTSNKNVGGLIFEFYKLGVNDTSYKEIPETNIAKTGNNYNIIVRRPSDVQFDEKNKNARLEYESMSADVNSIISTIQFN